MDWLPHLSFWGTKFEANVQCNCWTEKSKIIFFANRDGAQRLRVRY